MQSAEGGITVWQVFIYARTGTPDLCASATESGTA